MPINLSQLLAVLPVDIALNKKYSELKVNNLVLDSREVKKGDLFFAFKGVNLDSRNFISNAIENNAAVIIYDDVDYGISQNIQELAQNNDTILINLPNVAQYISKCASEFFGAPSESMQIFAVTGTNGKTTCNYLLAQCLYHLTQNKIGVIGTTGSGEISEVLNHNNRLSKLENTTPGPIQLQQLLFNFRSSNCQAVVMEASSHALDQYRLAGINVDTAIFTNISHDHLDYHKNIEDYYLAKRKLFMFSGLKNIIINIDEDYGKRLLQDLKTSDNFKKMNIILYGMDTDNIQHYNLPYVYFTKGKVLCQHDDTNSQFIDYQSQLIGKFNIYNNLAVVGAMLANNYDLANIEKVLPRLRPAPGRMEVFHQADKNVDVIVDYAHTPDALEKALLALNEHKTNNIWCVFGCGGDRDRQKRPIMGNVAVNFADKVIITDDNPRTEDSDNIINDIKKGIKPELLHKVFAIINNRRQAIKYALENSSSGDKILIAGKGHEDYQICGTEIIDYNEREYVDQLIK